MKRSLRNDIRPPIKTEAYPPQVEKTDVILPVDARAIGQKAAEIIRHPGNSTRRFFSILGPGVITGASDDDPSGIATYSVAGAQFGYQTLWLSLITYPLSAAVQEVCARIGLVTGHGLAAVTKRYYSRNLLYVVTLLLVIANTINIGADIQAMAATFQLLTPSVDFSFIAIGITALILFFLIVLSYKAYARYLKLASITLFSYIFVAFLAHVDWHTAIHSFLVPSLSMKPDYLVTLVGILGTTISPYMFFWQANEEVEEEIAKGMIRKDDPGTNHTGLRHISRRFITDMHIDVNVGMFYSELIMFFIITATAATIFSQHAVTNVTDLTLTQLANVLRPLVGDTAFLLFNLGVLGVGLLAVPVLAGSASYAIAELFDWKEGLNKKFHEAKGFYTVIVFATLIGLALNFIGVQPVAALYYTAVINGVVAAPLLIVIWLIGNNKKILGEHTSGWLVNTLMGITIIGMAAAAVALFVFH
ncbi:Nramp family divalent metal transporter [Patescibacteria group bacterium]|nr:Nramp family divalent metal transporter [Patescibacteria group bacterium]